MNDKLALKLSLFAQNVQDMKGKFIWQNALIRRLSALLYAVENKPVDCEAIRLCHEQIKQNTGLFSTFRGNSAIAIATMLSLSQNREHVLSDTLEIYEMLKRMKFWNSDYLAIAAYQIAASASPENKVRAIERARAFYEGLKKNHRFYTGQDDYIFAAMLGLSDVDVKAGTVRMEELYQLLKPEFFSGNSVHTLTQVLVLGGETGETVVRIHALREALRYQNIKLDREYTLPSLGILALLPTDVNMIAQDISDAHDFLRTQPGFGVWSVTKQELILFASAIVAFTYADDLKNNGNISAALCTSITNIIIAQEAAMAAVAASSAAAASASSSSN